MLAVGSVLLVYGVLRSRLGLALQAIRDNESGARGLGANVYWSRFAVFVLAALWTGFAGAVYYLQNLRVQPTAAFSVLSWTAPIIFIVVIGGLGTIEGPIVGAVVYYVLREHFADYADLVHVTNGSTDRVGSPSWWRCSCVAASGAHWPTGSAGGCSPSSAGSYRRRSED